MIIDIYIPKLELTTTLLRTFAYMKRAQLDQKAGLVEQNIVVFLSEAWAYQKRGEID